MIIGFIMKMRLSQFGKWLGPIMLTAAFQTVALAENDPVELISLRKAYADAHVEALEPLTKKYFQALASLKKKLSQAGDLEGAIIVESEEKGTNKTAEEHQPRELVRLNRLYKTTSERKSREVTHKYIKALHALQLKLTRSGDLEGAQKVKAEHQKYLTAKEDASKEDASKEDSSKTVKLSKREFTKLMTSGVWEWRASHKYSGKANLENVRFFEDGSCNIEWIWKWEIVSSSSVKVTFHDKKWNYYVFDMDFKKNRGLSNIEKGSFLEEDKKRANLVLKK